MATKWRLFFLALILLSAGFHGHSQTLWHGIRTDCGSSPVSSMSPEPPEAPSGGKWHKRIACLVDFFSDSPAHLAIGSIVPGSGIGGGISALQDLSGNSKYRALSGNVLYTSSGFWSANGQFLFQPFAYKLKHNGHECLGPFCAKDHFNIAIFAMHRELRSIDFFGLGPASNGSSKFNFGERDTVAGVTASLPLTNWMRLVSTLENHSPDIARSGDPVSVRQNFTEATLPGLATQPLFMRYDNLVELHNLPEPPYSALLRAGYDIYQSIDQSRYSFGQFHAAGYVSKKIEHDIKDSPGPIGSHFCPKTGKKDWTCDYGEITFSASTALSHTDAGDVVPFYDQPTLGGQDIDGNETLRGYPNYRFRGPHSLLMQVEYSHDLVIHIERRQKQNKDGSTTTEHVDWSTFAGYLFYDAGAVGLKVSDLALDRMRQDAGIGLKVKLAGTVGFRTYLAMGASGGPRWGWNLGRVF